MMLQLDVTLVPTMLVVSELLLHGREHGMPDYAHRKMVAITDRNLEAVQIAIAKGVRIALGTDVATSGADPAGSWGQNADELPLFVNAGVTTAGDPGSHREWTCHPRPTWAPVRTTRRRVRRGHVRVDRQSPLDEIAALTDPTTISWFWKGGQPVKSTVATNNQ